MTALHGRLGRAIGVVVLVVAVGLLTSVGGLGVAASPLTLTALLIVVTCHPTLPFVCVGSLVAGLTGLEGGWGLGYVVFGQFSSWTIATMILGGILGFGAVLALGLRARRRFLDESERFDLGNTQTGV